MASRSSLRQASVNILDPFYLVYFEADESISVVKKVHLLPEQNEPLSPGKRCQIRVGKGKTYEGIVVTYGLKDDVESVEDQYMCGVYTPEFLGDSEDSSTAPAKRTTSDSSSSGQDLTSSSKKTKASGKKRGKKKQEKQLPKQVSKIKLLATSAMVSDSSNSSHIDQTVLSTHTANVDQPVLSTQTVTQSAHTVSISQSQLPSHTTTVNQSSLPTHITNQSVERDLPTRNDMSIVDPLSQHSLDSSSILDESFAFEIEDPPPLPPSLPGLTSTNTIGHNHMRPEDFINLTNRVDRLEKQYDILLQHLFSLPSSPWSNSVTVSSSVNRSHSFLPTTSPAISRNAISIPSHHNSLPPSPVPLHNSLPPSPVPLHNSLPPSPVPLHNSLPPSPVPLHNSLQPPVSSHSSLPTSFASQHSSLPSQNSMLSSAPIDSQDFVQTAQLLMDPDYVIKKYPKLITISTIGRLAVRLSCEAYFGKELLKQCTVVGCNNKPPLPKQKVLELKSKLLSLFPQFISSPIEFEPLWSKCVGAINHCCAKLRSKDVAEL